MHKPFPESKEVTKEVLAFRARRELKFLSPEVEPAPSDAEPGEDWLQYEARTAREEDGII